MRWFGNFPNESGGFKSIGGGVGGAGTRLGLETFQKQKDFPTICRPGQSGDESHCQAGADFDPFDRLRVFNPFDKLPSTTLGVCDRVFNQRHYDAGRICPPRAN